MLCSSFFGRLLKDLLSEHEVWLCLQVNQWTSSVIPTLIPVRRRGVGGRTNKTYNLCEPSICGKASNLLINSHSLSSHKLWGLFLLSVSALWQSLPAVLMLMFLWSERLRSSLWDLSGLRLCRGKCTRKTENGNLVGEKKGKKKKKFKIFIPGQKMTRIKV